MAKMLRLFNSIKEDYRALGKRHMQALQASRKPSGVAGTKASRIRHNAESAAQLLHQHGWQRTNLGSPSKIHRYEHVEHPAHFIHHNTETGAFNHEVHHSYDLGKHLKQHHEQHLDVLHRHSDEL